MMKNKILFFAAIVAVSFFASQGIKAEDEKPQITPAIQNDKPDKENKTVPAIGTAKPVEKVVTGATVATTPQKPVVPVTIAASVSARMICKAAAKSGNAGNAALTGTPAVPVENNLSTPKPQLACLEMTSKCVGTDIEIMVNKEVVGSCHYDCPDLPVDGLCKCYLMPTKSHSGC